MKTFVWIFFISFFISSLYGDYCHNTTLSLVYLIAVILRGLIFYAFANRTCYFIDVRKKIKNGEFDEEDET